jgi:hypothetical protein
LIDDDPIEENPRKEHLMSLTNDLRFYADSARDNVVELTSKATSAVQDLRNQAEKAVSLDGLKSAAEPFVAQVLGYSTLVSERAEDVLSAVKQDKRVSTVLTTTEAVAGVVADVVHGLVIAPVQSLTGRGAKPAPVAHTAPTSTAARTVPAAKKAPAARKAAAKKPAATKAAAKKAPATKAPAARKVAAKKAPAKKATARA